MFMAQKIIANLAKESCFLSFEKRNEISSLFCPSGKTFLATYGKIDYWPSSGENPSDTHVPRNICA